MTMIRAVDVPQNLYIGVQLPRPALGVRIENLSNQTVSVKDDLGKDTDICPPGFTLGWLHPEGLYSPQIGCVGYYQGNARVYFYDTDIDISQNPNTQQPGGIANISATSLESLVTQLINLTTALNTLVGTTNTNTGNTNTNVVSLQTLINTLNTLMGTNNTNTGNTNTNVVNLATLINTSNSLDADIKALITTLNTYANMTQDRAGALIKTNSAAFTVNNNAEFTQAITRSLGGFSLAIPSQNIVGFLTVFWAFNGQNVYQMYQNPIIPYANAGVVADKPGPEWEFVTDVPSGAVIHVAWKNAQSAASLAGTLSW